MESLKLSPERVTGEASATTQIVNEVLEQEENRYYVRHWGINE